MTSYTVHACFHYGTYAPVGVYAQRQDAMKALVQEVAKGTITAAWIRFFDDTKLIYSWKHDRDTLADAQSAAECVL